MNGAFKPVSRAFIGASGFHIEKIRRQHHDTGKEKDTVADSSRCSPSNTCDTGVDDEKATERINMSTEKTRLDFIPPTVASLRWIEQLAPLAL